MVDARGWVTAPLPILCFVLGTIVGLLVDGFIAQPGTIAEFLIRLQPLFGAVLVAAAVAIAAAIVGKRPRGPMVIQAPAREEDVQAAVQLLAREEDRIDANFAGLDDAARLLQGLRTELGLNELDVRGAIPRDKLSQQGLWLPPDRMAEVVRQKLPSTDLLTRKRVEGLLNYLVARIEQVIDARTEAAQATHDVELARQASSLNPETREEYERLHASALETISRSQASFEESRRRIERLHEELSATILRWRRDRPVIRGLLETYIDKAISKAKGTATG
jgi:hypothetical protein